MSGQPLLIFPCNGNAVEAVDCLGSAYELIGFMDDAPEKHGQHPLGFPVFSREALKRWPKARVLAVPGSPRSYRMRQEVIDGLDVQPDRFASVIHMQASISSHSRLGCNVLIMAGVVVTATARIGSHVCILPNTVIHHHSTIGDWTLIGASVTIAGSVTIGENCYIGSGANLIDGVAVGQRALVGLGANVLRHVRRAATVAGNPAREL
jgi:sugar O-acyltransferase (sialic acid O-acetyltransferase NeuD family)